MNDKRNYWEEEPDGYEWSPEGIEDLDDELPQSAEDYEDVSDGDFTEADHLDADDEPHEPVATTGRGASSPAASQPGMSRRKAGLIASGVAVGLAAVTGGALFVFTGGTGGGTPSPSAIEQAARNTTEPAANESRNETVSAQIEADNAAVNAMSEPDAGNGNEPPTAGGNDGLDRAEVRSMIEQALADQPDEPAMDAATVNALIDERGGDIQAMIDDALADRSGASGLDEEAVIALIDERMGRQSGDGERSDAIAAMESRVDELAERVAALDTQESGEGSTNDALAERLNAQEKTLYTALANSRLALEALRTGDYNANRDWREINDAGENESLDGNTRAASSDEPITGWDLVGIGRNQAMIRSPSGSTYRVEPGDRVEDIGTVQAVNAGDYTVVMTGGVIRGG